MVVAQQEVGPAFQHQRLARLHVVGGQADGTDRSLLLQGTQPGREEGQGQRMGRSEAQGGRIGLCRLPRLLLAQQQAAQHLGGCGAEPFAGGRQRRLMRAAVHQGGADPVLQHPDAAAERGLGDVAPGGGPGEVAGFREGQEVLQPRDVQLPLPHGLISKPHWPARPTAP